MELNRIKEVLKAKHKSNNWLAEQLGVSHITVSRWCSNTAQPTLETLFKIASLLSINPKDLIQTTQK